jgi:hypothetical protein
MNYWTWVKSYGDSVAGTESEVAALAPKILRIGGHNNDNNKPEPFSHAEIDAAIAYAKSVGAEPLLQVPLLSDEVGAEPSADTAAAMVEYVNVTQHYGVRYFSIGNEPDLYPDQMDKPASYSANDACTAFKAFATAMKAVSPEIKIVGPDLSWKYQSGANDWLTPFLQNCGDQIDVVAIHRYPLDPTMSTAARARGDSLSLSSTIDAVRAKMTAAGVGDKPLAVTETNITWDGDPAKSVLDASPGTFPAGLWVADTFGVALTKQLWTTAFWSISEGWTLGFISPSGQLRPAYHALKLYADHFGPTLLAVSGAPSSIGVYASRSAADDATLVVVVNHSTSDYDLTLVADDLAGVNATRRFPASSLSALALPDSGVPTLTRYTADDWAADRPPQNVE